MQKATGKMRGEIKVRKTLTFKLLICKAFFLLLVLTNLSVIFQTTGGGGA